MKRLVLTIAILLGLSAPAWAGFAEGVAAYERGDYATALREWRPLAEQGNALAQYNLGVMYDNGRGVPQDYAEAMKWYRKAAAQGHAWALWTLGGIYENGLAVPQDYVEAHKWYNLAAAQGNKTAAKYRDNAAKRMTPAQIAEAQRLAREWKPRNDSSGRPPLRPLSDP